MPAVSVEALLRQLEAAGTKFGQVATQLSEKIESIQCRLIQLPGKAPVEINDEDIKLAFDRTKSGKEWYLWYSDSESKDWEHLTGVSVLKKARALHALPRLFSELEKVQLTQLEQVESALQELPLDIDARLINDQEGQ